MICRNCGAGLEAEQIDTSLGIVTCSHCGGLHDIPSDKFTSPASSDASASATHDTPHGTNQKPRVKPRRLEVALPEKFQIQRSTSSMEITWAVGGIFHGLVLSGMAVGVSFMAVESGMLFLFAASAWLLYFALVRAVNKHHVRVDKARLQVTQGPLPWPGQHKLDTSDITQLYATEHESRVETDNGANRKVRVSKYYKLLANTRKGSRITILRGLRDPLQALWLEQEIEQLLNIADQPVAGEHIP